MLLISFLYEVNFNIVLKLTSYREDLNFVHPEVKNLFIPCLSLENMVNSVNKHIPKNDILRIIT